MAVDGRGRGADEPPAALTRVVMRGASLASAGYVVTQAITLASYLALARLATPEDFGVFAAGSILVALGLLVGESGMLSALIQRRDRVEEAATTAFVATMAAGVGLGLLALALSPLVGRFFGSGEITSVAAVLSGTVLLRQAAIVPDALLQRRFSFIRRLVTEPLSAVAFGITAILLTARGHGVWGLVAGAYAATTMHLVLTWAFVRWRPRLRDASFALWRDLAGFGRHVLAGEIVRRGSSQVDTVLLGRFVGTAALGQYQYALRVASTPLGALVSIGAYVLLPAFSRISADAERFRHAFTRSLALMAALAFPASLALLPLGVPTMVLLFGERWREAGYAVMAMSLLSAGHALDSVASEAFKAAGRPEFLPRMHGIAAVVAIAFMVTLLPFGLVGIAAALSISAVAVAAYALYAAGRVVGIPVRDLLRSVWPPAVASVAMAAVVFLVEAVLDADGRGGAAGIAVLAGEAALAAVVYVASLAVVSPKTVREAVAAVRSRRSSDVAGSAP